MGSSCGDLILKHSDKKKQHAQKSKYNQAKETPINKG